MMNNSSVSFGHHGDIAFPYVFKTVFCVALFVVVLVSTIGNFLVIITSMRAQNLRTSTNYYITNMAVSDLLFVATRGALYGGNRVSVFGHSLSALECKFGRYLTLISYSVSTISLVMITVDRFVATVFPMKVIMISGRKRMVFILISWIISLAIFLPYLLFSTITEDLDGQIICITRLNGKMTNRIYVSVCFLLLYCTPLIVIIILNSRIVKSLRRTSRVLQGDGLSNIRRRKQNQRTMKVVILITVLYFICWTPNYAFMFLAIGFRNIFKADIRVLLSTVFKFFLPFLSTAVNPFILFSFSTNYRRALKNCLCLPVVKCRPCYGLGH